VFPERKSKKPPDLLKNLNTLALPPAVPRKTILSNSVKNDRAAGTVLCYLKKLPVDALKGHFYHNEGDAIPPINEDLW